MTVPIFAQQHVPEIDVDKALEVGDRVIGWVKDLWAVSPWLLSIVVIAFLLIKYKPWQRFRS